MKRILMNTRTFAVATIAILTISFATQAQANEEKKTPVELTFLGKIENQPVFQLTINNEEENEFTVIVRDATNNILYKDIIKGGNISKKFLLDSEALGDTTIRFEITGKKTDKTVIYEVNKTSRVVDNVTVNKKN